MSSNHHQVDMAPPDCVLKHVAQIAGLEQIGMLDVRQQARVLQSSHVLFGFMPVDIEKAGRKIRHCLRCGRRFHGQHMNNQHM
jgi:hypothetical protein